MCRFPVVALQPSGVCRYTRSPQRNSKHKLCYFLQRQRAECTNTLGAGQFPTFSPPHRDHPMRMVDNKQPFSRMRKNRKQFNLKTFLSVQHRMPFTTSWEEYFVEYAPIAGGGFISTLWSRCESERARARVQTSSDL